jgi:hypothetical protein
MQRNSYPIETIIACCTSYRASTPVTAIVKESGVPRSTINYLQKSPPCHHLHGGSFPL